MKINIEILDDDDFKAGFFNVIKIPEELVGINEETFITNWIKAQITNVYKTGKVKIAKETTPPEVNYDIIKE